MKTLFAILSSLAIALLPTADCDKCYDNEDFQIKSASVTHNKDLDVTIWEIKVKGAAGATTPKAVGKLNGAPVLGYVFPTTLKPTDVGLAIQRALWL